MDFYIKEKLVNGNIGLDDSLFKKIKFQTIESILESVSLKANIDKDVILKNYKKEIDLKYYNILKSISIKYITFEVYSSIKNCNKEISFFGYHESGEIFLFDENKKEIKIFLNISQLNSNYLLSLKRYKKEKWNITRASKINEDKNNIFKFLIENNKFKIEYKKIDGSIIDLNCQVFEYKNPEIKSKGVSIPEWTNYVFPNSYKRELLNTTNDRKEFYNYLKSEFINGNYIDVKNNSTYYFMLMFDILETSNEKEKAGLLYNLGLCYPKTFRYHLDLSYKVFIDKNNFL